MDQFPGHKCQLTFGSRTYLPKLLPTANWWEVLLRKFRISLIVSMKNPITSRYFKSQGAIAREHRRQAKLPYTVIHPCCHFMAYWSIIVLFTYAIYLFIIPFYIAFHEQIPNPGPINKTLQFTISVILYLEIVVKMFSGYYDSANEVYVLDRQKIQIKYLKSTFFPDLISSFPGLLVLRRYSDFEHMKIRHFIFLYIIFFMFLLSFLNVPKIVRYYRIISVYYEFTARIDLTIKLGLCSLYVIHLATLFNEIVPALGQFVEQNAFKYSYSLVHDIKILKPNNVFGTMKGNPNSTDLNDPVYAYARAFLYTMEGFIGSGFVNSNEVANIYKKYVSTFTMLTGWICKAVFIIILKQTIMSHDRSAVLYDGFVREVKSYSEQYKLPNDLTENIFMYIKYKFRNNYFNEKQIFRTLSSQLKSQITMDQCKQLVEQVELFNNVPKPTIKNIIGCLKLEIYLPGETIIKVGDKGSKMFFLETGSAVVVTETGKEVKYFEDGSYFGEIALLIPNKRRTASVIAVELCETYSLSQNDFFNVIEPNSGVLQQLQEIALERLNVSDEHTL